MTPPNTLPLVILGGSDQKAGTLPAGSDSRPLTGCKGIDVRVGDRYLIEDLIGRLRQFEKFHPIYIVGPKDVYAVTDAADEVFDSNKGFGGNIGAGIAAARERHGDGPMAMITCDVLPEQEDLHILYNDYQKGFPSDLWFPMIEAPYDSDDLGASSWKPKYFVANETDSEPVPVLPCHLAIFDPKAMRLSFLYQLLELAYETRNQPIAKRRNFLLRKLMTTVLGQDLKLLSQFKLPTLAVDIIFSGVAAAQRLKRQDLPRPALEKALRRMFVQRTHRKLFPNRRIQMPILPAMSLAKDLDTHEEVAAAGGTTGSLKTAASD